MYENLLILLGDKQMHLKWLGPPRNGARAGVEADEEAVAGLGWAGTVTGQVADVGYGFGPLTGVEWTTSRKPGY